MEKNGIYRNKVAWIRNYPYPKLSVRRFVTVFFLSQVGVLGLTFPYKQGESKVQPGFTFMDISDRYVIARGAGGGLALWLRQDTV